MQSHLYPPFIKQRLSELSVAVYYKEVLDVWRELILLVYLFYL